MGIAFSVAAVICLVLVFTRQHHLHWTGDRPDSGPQKVHSQPIARVGGIGILAGLVAGLVWMQFNSPAGLQDDLKQLHSFWLVLAASPLVVLGLVEDVQGSVSIRLRLAASLAAGALVWFMADVRVLQLRLPLVDELLLAAPIFSLLFTVVAVGGLVHAMNIVDGLNGLLAGMAMLMFGAVAVVALEFGEPVLACLALTGMAAVGGFAVCNFPHAKIFCGDAGAYLVGYLAAVLLVLLCLRQPVISPWFAMAVVMHPVTETLYSAWRRMRSGHGATQPDARHMHSLWLARMNRLQSTTGHAVWLGPNAAASLRTLAFAVVPMVLAIGWPTDTPVLMGICVFYLMVFVKTVQVLEQSGRTAALAVTTAGAVLDNDVAVVVE